MSRSDTKGPNEIFKDAEKHHMFGRYTEADILYGKARERLDEMAKGEDGSALQDKLLKRHVRLLLQSGALEEAEKLAREHASKVESRHGRIGAGGPMTACAIRLYAEAKRRARDFKGEATLLRQALEIWMDALGWKSPEPDVSSFDLEDMAGPKQMNPDAVWIVEKVRSLASKANVPDDQKDAGCFFFLAEMAYIFSRLDKPNIALQLFKECTGYTEDIPAILLWENAWMFEEATAALISAGQAELALSFILDAQARLSELSNEQVDVKADLLVAQAMALSHPHARPEQREEAMECLTEADEMLRSYVGDDNIRVGPVLEQMANILMFEEDQRNCEKRYQSVLQIAELNRDKEPDRLIDVLIRKGEMHRHFGSLEKAEKCLTTACDLIKPNNPAEVDRQAGVLEQLSTLYLEERRYNKAEGFQVRCMELLREHGESTSLRLSLCEMAMAKVFLITAKFVEAEKNAMSALSVIEKQGAKMALEEAELHLLLGKIQLVQERIEEADRSFRRARVVAETLASTDRLDLLLFELNLEESRILLIKEKFKECSAKISANLELDELQNGSERGLSNKKKSLSLKLAESQRIAALAECGQGRRDTAYALLSSGKKRIKEQSGERSEAYLYASIYEARFRLDHQEFEGLDETLAHLSTLVSEEKKLESSPSHAETLDLIASAAARRGDPSRALDSSKRALDIREKCFGAAHPICGENWLDISFFQAQQGEPERSDEAAHRAITLISKKFDKLRFKMARALAWQASISLERKQTDSALAILDPILSILESTHRAPDLLMARSLSSIIHQMLKDRRTDDATIIGDYVEKHATSLLLFYRQEGLEILLDFVNICLSREQEDMAGAISEAIIDAFEPGSRAAGDSVLQKNSETSLEKMWSAPKLSNSNTARGLLSRLATSSNN